MPAEAAVVEVPAEGAAGHPEDSDEPPEDLRAHEAAGAAGGAGGRGGLMKPLVVLALPGMYLFYKYSQYRREQRELSRRRVTERELQHLHHKIDKLLTKLEENEPELASSQEDEMAGWGPPPGPPPPSGGGGGGGGWGGWGGGGNSGGGSSGSGGSTYTTSTTSSSSGSGSLPPLTTTTTTTTTASSSSGSGSGGGGGGGGGGGWGNPPPRRWFKGIPPQNCVICVNARASMQTAPCGHRVVCRRCFVKTIQMAVSQRLLPLRCVICRAKILRLKQTLIPRDYSMSGKSWVLPQSASAYSMGASVAGNGASGPGVRWSPSSVPPSASLYSMASGSSSLSGVSSVSSATSASTSSSGISTGKPNRLRQPTGATLRRSQTQSMKLRIQEYQDPIQQVPEEEEIIRENRERRLPPIKEFQRDYRAGKASTRIRCAQKIVTQLEASPSPRSVPNVTPVITPREVPSSASARSSTKSAKKSPSMPKTPMTVAQEVQKTKKEKEREKEREKAEKARQKEEEKAEKARQKEAKKMAKEEKKRAKKEAKARRKETEEALLRDDK